MASEDDFGQTLGSVVVSNRTRLQAFSPQAASALLRETAAHDAKDASAADDFPRKEHAPKPAPEERGHESDPAAADDKLAEHEVLEAARKTHYVPPKMTERQQMAWLKKVLQAESAGKSPPPPPTGYVMDDAGSESDATQPEDLLPAYWTKNLAPDEIPAYKPPRRKRRKSAKSAKVDASGSEPAASAPDAVGAPLAAARKTTGAAAAAAAVADPSPEPEAAATHMGASASASTTPSALAPAVAARKKPVAAFAKNTASVAASSGVASKSGVAASSDTAASSGVVAKGGVAAKAGVPAKAVVTAKAGAAAKAGVAAKSGPVAKGGVTQEPASNVATTVAARKPSALTPASESAAALSGAARKADARARARASASATATETAPAPATTSTGPETDDELGGDVSDEPEASSPAERAAVSYALEVCRADEHPVDWELWSASKQRSWQRLRAAPNAWLMTNTAPGVVARTGKWSAAEHDVFLAAFGAHPPRGRWGLFSVHVPGRVGTQCLEYCQLLLATGVLTESASEAKTPARRGRSHGSSPPPSPHALAAVVAGARSASTSTPMPPSASAAVTATPARAPAHSLATPTPTSASVTVSTPSAPAVLPPSKKAAAKAARRVSAAASAERPPAPTERSSALVEPARTFSGVESADAATPLRAPMRVNRQLMAEAAPVKPLEEPRLRMEGYTSPASARHSRATSVVQLPLAPSDEPAMPTSAEPLSIGAPLMMRSVPSPSRLLAASTGHTGDVTAARSLELPLRAVPSVGPVTYEAAAAASAAAIAAAAAAAAGTVSGHKRRASADSSTVDEGTERASKIARTLYDEADASTVAASRADLDLLSLCLEIRYTNMPSVLVTPAVEVSTMVLGPKAARLWDQHHQQREELVHAFKVEQDRLFRFLVSELERAKAEVPSSAARLGRLRGLIRRNFADLKADLEARQRQEAQTLACWQVWEAKQLHGVAPTAPLPTGPDTLPIQFIHVSFPFELVPAMSVSRQ